MKNEHYRNLGFVTIISFCIMYLVMFLNVNDASHIYLSLTRTYMSLLMVTPMSVLMLFVMKKMYPDERLNTLIITTASALFIVSLYLLRMQTFVTDEQYMKAMIPHHSSAIMTSRNANITDSELKELSEGIITSQEKEIAQMKQILQRFDK